MRHTRPNELIVVFRRYIQAIKRVDKRHHLLMDLLTLLLTLLTPHVLLKLLELLANGDNPR
jgi:hypothetical protein